MATYSRYGFRPYVPVAKRRAQAAREAAKRRKAGHDLSPIEISGRKIARTFWGEAWCTNLEAYSDYSNRLPRGRTYVRNGSVIDLKIEEGRVRSLVSGSSIYEVDIRIEALAKKTWRKMTGECAGQIGSLVELLRGSISKGVMEIVTRRDEGLFPTPREISLSCSCPDWATMCKHIAATLYGVGSRLDGAPELLFTLRGVDPSDMVDAAVKQPVTANGARRGRVLKSSELSSVFGIDIDASEEPQEEAPAPARKLRSTTKAGKTTTRKRKATAKAKSKKAGVRKARPEEKTAEKARTTKAATKKSKASAKKASKKKVPKKKVPKKKAPKKKAPKKKAPKKKVPKKKVPKKKVPKKKAPKKKVPKKKAPRTVRGAKKSATKAAPTARRSGTSRQTKTGAKRSR